MPPSITIIFGPTAVGKTELLLKLFPGKVEVINADSMQVYRYLDIGTAKPPAEVLARLPHHLIDIVDPDYQFNVGGFVRRADGIIQEIHARDRKPVMAGGTAFYLRTFIYGLPSSPVGNPHVRQELKDLLRERGLPYLIQELRAVDPAAAATINPRDRYRVMRALEVYRTSGRPLSSFKPPQEPRQKYRFSLVGLYRKREELYRRIDERVDTMFAAGLMEEFQELRRRGYREHDPGMRGIGYRELFALEKGEGNLEEVKALIKRNSRRYARRQITFFRSLPGVRWFCPEELEGIQEYIHKRIAAY